MQLISRDTQAVALAAITTFSALSSISGPAATLNGDSPGTQAIPAKSNTVTNSPQNWILESKAFPVFTASGKDASYSDLAGRSFSIAELSRKTGKEFVVVVQAGEACPHALASLPVWSKLSQATNTLVIWAKNCSSTVALQTVRGNKEHFKNMVAIADPLLAIPSAMIASRNRFASTAFVYRSVPDQNGNSNHLTTIVPPKFKSDSGFVEAPAWPFTEESFTALTQVLGKPASNIKVKIDADSYPHGCPLAPCSHFGK